MSKHTPTPWAVEKMPSGRITITSGQFFVAGNDCSHGMHEEDAAHIVRCVNSHEALVKAANYAAAVLSGNDLSKSGLVVALESIRDALAAAGAPQ